MDAKLLTLGRWLLATAVFTIPLAFCRETMYIFQVKSIILQYVGFGLMLLITAHQVLSKDALNLWRSWIFRLLWVFLAWEIFKCWDSICPLISWRQMSRIYWLPVMAISVFYFLRNRNHIEWIINVVILSAIFANVYMWLIYIDWTHAEIFGMNAIPARQAQYDFYNFPGLGYLAKAIFYPPPFDQVEYMGNTNFFPITSHSFFAGKAEAGTFGSKNFITGYLNMTSILLIYRSLTLTIFNEKRSLRHFVIALILVVIALPNSSDFFSKLSSSF